jgi:hypothetical protein
MTYEQLAALITQDLRTVGFSIDEHGAWIARFKEDVPPDTWRKALFEEWNLGEGAALRAVMKLAETYELEGFFKPPPKFDPAAGNSIILGHLQEES